MKYIGDMFFDKKVNTNDHFIRFEFNEKNKYYRMLYIDKDVKFLRLIHVSCDRY